MCIVVLLRSVSQNVTINNIIFLTCSFHDCGRLMQCQPSDIIIPSEHFIRGYSFDRLDVESPCSNRDAHRGRSVESQSRTRKSASVLPRRPSCRPPDPFGLPPAGASMSVQTNESLRQKHRRLPPQQQQQRRSIQTNYVGVSVRRHRVLTPSARQQRQL